MKDIMLTVIIFILINNCNSNKEIINKHNNYISINVIDSILRYNIIEFIKNKEKFNTENVITVNFNHKSNFKIPDKICNSIIISTKIDKESIKNYKGVYKIKDYNIALFDSSNFGYKYYDINHLKKIPFDSLKFSNDRIVEQIVLIIENGKMRCLW